MVDDAEYSGQSQDFITAGAIRIEDSWVSDRDAHDAKRLALFTEFYTRSMEVALNRFLKDVLFNQNTPPNHKPKPEQLASFVAAFAEGFSERVLEVRRQNHRAGSASRSGSRR